MRGAGGIILIVLLLCGAWRLVRVVPLTTHARPKVFGEGWECDQGFYRKNGRCLPVMTPEYGRLNRRGDGWECIKGYVPDGSLCAPLRIPPNAEMDTFGNGWHCRRGFYQSGSQCLAVTVPDNARVDAEGHGWECLRGFRKKDDACVSMSVAEMKALKDREQKEYEQSQRNGPSTTTACGAGYNKCTSACYGELQDPDTGKALQSTDFIDKCFMACGDGKARCEISDDENRCAEFVRACHRLCPELVRAFGQGGKMSGVDGRMLCEEACKSGESRCAYQARQSPAP